MASLTLEALFPRLPFAREADRFLATTARSEPLYVQITGRRIYELRECALLISVAGVCRMVGGGFFLQFSDLVDIEQKTRSFGHELAHTFGFDIRPRHPRRLLPRRIDDATADQVEDFCDAFSERWLALQNPQKVRELLASELRMSKLNVVHRCYVSPESLA